MSLAEGNGVGGVEAQIVDFALQAVVDAVEAIDLLSQFGPCHCFLPELIGLGREADVGAGLDGAVLRTAELRRHEVISPLIQQPIVLLEFVVLLAVLMDESVDEVELFLELAHPK